MGTLKNQSQPLTFGGVLMLHDACRGYTFAQRDSDPISVT